MGRFQWAVPLLLCCTTPSALLDNQSVFKTRYETAIELSSEVYSDQVDGTTVSEARCRISVVSRRPPRRCGTCTVNSKVSSSRYVAPSILALDA
jgi:hypothetical protein